MRFVASSAPIKNPPAGVRHERELLIHELEFNLLQGVLYRGLVLRGALKRFIKGDTRSLDTGSHEPQLPAGSRNGRSWQTWWFSSGSSGSRCPRRRRRCCPHCWMEGRIAKLRHMKGSTAICLLGGPRDIVTSYDWASRG